MSQALLAWVFVCSVWKPRRSVWSIILQTWLQLHCGFTIHKLHPLKCIWFRFFLNYLVMYASGFPSPMSQQSPPQKISRVVLQILHTSVALFDNILCTWLSGAMYISMPGADDLLLVPAKLLLILLIPISHSLTILRSDNTRMLAGLTSAYTISGAWRNAKPWKHWTVMPIHCNGLRARLVVCCAFIVIPLKQDFLQVF